MENIRVLTRGLRRANDSAWHRFHAEYYDFLVGVARARGVDGPEVADVIQRTYLRILKHAKVFEDEADFRAWVCCLLRSEVVDTMRSRQRRIGLMEKVKGWIFVNSEELAGESMLEGMAIADRRLLERHYVDGWSQSELAAEMGVSVKAMESRLARLRGSARSWLETEERKMQ